MKGVFEAITMEGDLTSLHLWDNVKDNDPSWATYAQSQVGISTMILLKECWQPGHKRRTPLILNKSKLLLFSHIKYVSEIRERKGSNSDCLHYN